MNGSIRARSKGSWQIRYEGPSDTTGMRKYLSETVKGTKKEAERVLGKGWPPIENGGYVPRAKETVAEYMYRWLDIYAATNVTLRTQQGYRAYVKGYIEPAIGNIPLQSLTAPHIQAIDASMLERRLCPTTIVQLHRILKQALSHAVKWGF